VTGSLKSSNQLTPAVATRFVHFLQSGCEERDPLRALWYDVFGLSGSVLDSVRLEKENVEEDIVQLGPKPFSVEIDLMTPIDPEKTPKVGH